MSSVKIESHSKESIRSHAFSMSSLEYLQMSRPFDTCQMASAFSSDEGGCRSGQSWITAELYCIRSPGKGWRQKPDQW